MSDFLDRLAERAIGGESVLQPRLPSLFEPLAGAAPMSIMAETQSAAELPRGASVRASSSVEPREQTPPHASSPDHAATVMEAAAVPPITAIASQRTSAQPSQITASPNRADARRAIGAPAPKPARPDPATTIARVPVQPRHARVLSTAGVPLPPPASSGALLPVAPVFATARANGFAANPPAAAVSARARFAVAEASNASEPIVHVSIGRLEVRAAPASVAPNHRDEPRPSSLDDYLRQRGKASP